ncbi:AAA family ATPase [Nocardiopsis quinghaiensis]|uniref:AAA family ATPase n=1 Tax=Nocardiopsis quinghaiensis TaxID=464995 RepID=UPI00123A61B7|nr:AAA family ATPase [Nocardiopsis quinghaiensis]
MRISHENRPYGINYSGLTGATVHHVVGGKLTAPVEPARRDELIREGDLFEDDGRTPITGPRAKRLRARLLGTYAHLPDAGSSTLAARAESGAGRKRRMLIPGLWAWGTIPMLSGTKGAGKTGIVADLATALVVPGYRFLGRFGPADMDEGEKRPREVVLINPETHPEDFDAPLSPVVDYEEIPFGDDAHPAHRLCVEHLEKDWGSAASFDVTQTANFEEWGNYLVRGDEDDPLKERAPLAVIVDGLTAILGNNTSRYGEWYAKFRELMRACDVPNALVVTHNIMRGDHAMGGVEATAGPDGVWSFSMDDADNPFSPRRFSVRPRTGAVRPIRPTTVVLSEEGRPVMSAQPYEVVRADTRGASVGAGGAADPRQEGIDTVTAYVRAHPHVSGQELTDQLGNVSKQWRKDAVAAGTVEKYQCASEAPCECASNHGRRWHFLVVE